MYTILLTLLVLDGLFLGVIVLLQSGKGGGLAAMGGSGTATDGILGGRQATTMLTRGTWITGSAFMGLALILSIMSSRAQLPESILRQDVAPVMPAAQPILPSLNESGDAGEGSQEATDVPPNDEGND
ncbi:MAG: preprotein translocase subunit SecG [Gemmatimonadota bacterium]|uniref:Protein-export membrane protein SecG n=1 Tax=marine metagenome TaxID=408172 RepID=A0A382AZM6_9ZZZZ|nr:preprotein translocase subunit SecG [Gemmatimonadota bacterium]